MDEPLNLWSIAKDQVSRRMGKKFALSFIYDVVEVISLGQLKKRLKFDKKKWNSVLLADEIDDKHMQIQW